MEYICKSNVKINGKRYKAGEKINLSKVENDQAKYLEIFEVKNPDYPGEEKGKKKGGKK